ncbi:gamma-glutamyl-gamma-aminobutyrate hydrolase family protein [Pyrinomonas methylaliphatogenes]|uniref:gamma-glutamyl-gamma-aminobutyrate hydrolase n=1 Tax=Pyrinomonas methylaliphatogenes TaxID=454194 RepID=A0A0B6WUS4_9BACT|nr:gamma-glutamyl-gamma-aminobutyrate hydrolase family protein [Pyrinomonas methylaliphatogenes]CDM64796.1 predicted glutamine amidotransferase [Pyrinomonas methylaliphatogenes]
MKRPLIGLTLRYDPRDGSGYLSSEYAAALEAAGGAPVHLALLPEEEYVEAVVERVAGLLLPGSASDVDPRLYGREPHPELGEVHEVRDRVERLVIAAAERRRLPLLAICYGMQAWNVFRGGTLIQDIAAEYGTAIAHRQRAPRGERTHWVDLLEGSRVALLAGARRLWVNSHHHQAVEVVGEGLRATAWAEDGIIEAIEAEDEDWFAVGVQWHPEVRWAEDEFSRALFRRFVQECRAR